MRLFTILFICSLVIFSCKDQKADVTQKETEASIKAPSGFEFSSDTHGLSEFAKGPETAFAQAFKEFDIFCSKSEKSEYLHRTEWRIDSMYIGSILWRYGVVPFSDVLKEEVEYANQGSLKDVRFQFCSRHITNILVVKQIGKNILVAFDYAEDFVLKTDKSKHVITENPEENLSFAYRDNGKWYFYVNPYKRLCALLCIKLRMKDDNDSYMDFIKTIKEKSGLFSNSIFNKE